MFVNKFFINKQSGIKPNGISKWFFWLIGMLALLIGMGSNLSCPISGQAANNLQTYTQPFQNSTTTLSGDAVEIFITVPPLLDKEYTIVLISSSVKLII